MKSRTLPARITLISHAPTLATKTAAFPCDEPLLEGEDEKIRALRWTAPRAQQVLCGPERRTQQTAQSLGLQSCVQSELSDVNYGNWNGKTFEELQTSDPEGLTVWLSDPYVSPHGGDSLVELITRVDTWMNEQTSAGHTLAVTHPALIRAAIVNAIQAPPMSFWRVEIAPLSITDLRFNGRAWTVRSSGASLRV